MPRTKKRPFQRNLLAIAITASLTPAWALDLVQAPPLPTSKSEFVAPNVIISIDDSDSMDYGVKTGGNGSIEIGKGYTIPDDNGNWADNARRLNVLKFAVKEVFNDKTLIPDNKIRLAWQAMHDTGADSVNKPSMTTNSMRSIDATVGQKTHRDNFLSFIASLKTEYGTPSPKMMSQADAYMRRPLNNISPWSSDPGGTSAASTEYLGCRRNYHILMTDGRWLGTASGGNQDNKAWSAANGRQAYDPDSAQTQVYRDKDDDTLADWAFRSWMDPLQDAAALKDADKIKPSKLYDDAPVTQLFTKTKDSFKYEVIEGDRKEKTCEETYSGHWVDNPEGSGKRCKIESKETKSVSLQKYWNPQYNPATWPHMVTYTIGFSEEATTWPSAKEIIAPTAKVPFGYDNSFIDLVTGWQTWPNMGDITRRSLDLWHSAINGRGRFYAVTEAEDLAKAFRSIIGKINADSVSLPDQITGGSAASGYNVSSNNAGIFASVYNPKKNWSGSITATRAVDPEEYACPTKDDLAAKCIRFADTVSGWESKSTADRLDALASLDDRLILSWSDETGSGIPFKWTNVAAIGYSAAQKKALLGIGVADTITDELKSDAQDIVNYIRGDRSLEATTRLKPMRERTSRQGDVINSEIWYTGRPTGNYAMGYSSFVRAQKSRTPVLYVGGNDGMLHGFSAENGRELLAYVPRGVVGGLKDLTDKDYKHRYYVDGSPMTGDVKDASTWKTLLVSALGAGGKGYFVLNVTNPAGFSTSTAADLVSLDRTRGNTEAAPDCSALVGAAKTTCNTAVDENNDIGNIVAQPGRNPANLQEATQITLMNNGRWAVVMGNGYNSANQSPVLLVQYLDGDKSLKRIRASTDAKGSGNAKDNGLSSPALVDLDGDGKTDVVYAGDNLGNLWKFDLTSAVDSNWSVAFGNNKPLFTARGPVSTASTARDQIQPITAPPIVRANNRMMTVGTGVNAKTIAVGGMMVAFGTGRNVTAEDRRTDLAQNVQTLYSVLDNTRYRMKADKKSLEVHPGSGDCASVPATCIPTPMPAGVMASDGKPLAKQSVTTVSGNSATVTATQELKKETWKDYKGWYLDLPYSGERLLKPMQFYDGSNILAVYSESPAGIESAGNDNINESCVASKVNTSAGVLFRTFINIMDGKLPSIQLVDLTGDGVYNSDDKNVVRTKGANGSGTPVSIKTGGSRGLIKDSVIGDLTNTFSELSLRPSWRQLR